MSDPSLYQGVHPMLPTAFFADGIFASDFIRAPGMVLDDRSRREFEGLVARVGLSFDVPLEVA